MGPLTDSRSQIPSHGLLGLFQKRGFDTSIHVGKVKVKGELPERGTSSDFVRESSDSMKTNVALPGWLASPCGSTLVARATRFGTRLDCSRRTVRMYVLQRVTGHIP